MTLYESWTLPDNPPPCPGCFVIPSYALRSRTEPTLPTRRQIDLAFTWWQRFPGSKLILSTGDNQGLGITNARVMAQYAGRLGIPAQDLIEEDRSRNTYQNLLYSWKIAGEHGLRQPTLVTLDLYTRRAVAVARKMGWTDLYWLSAYSEGEGAWGYKWLQTRSRATILGYEMAASVFGKLAGWQ